MFECWVLQAIDELNAEMRKQKEMGIEREKELKEQLTKRDGELTQANATILALKNEVSVIVGALYG